MKNKDATSEDNIRPLTLVIKKRIWDDVRLVAKAKEKNLNDFVVDVLIKEVESKKKGLQALRE